MEDFTSDKLINSNKIRDYNIYPTKESFWSWNDMDRKWQAIFVYIEYILNLTN